MSWDEGASDIPPQWTDAVWMRFADKRPTRVLEFSPDAFEPMLVRWTDGPRGGEWDTKSKSNL